MVFAFEVLEIWDGEEVKNAVFNAAPVQSQGHRGTLNCVLSISAKYEVDIVSHSRLPPNSISQEGMAPLRSMRDGRVCVAPTSDS